LQQLRDAEVLQNARAVRANLNPCAFFRELRAALVNLGRDATL
jgi:hypothetical protein